jgi:hypothetical protein
MPGDELPESWKRRHSASGKKQQAASLTRSR